MPDLRFPPRMQSTIHTPASNSLQLKPALAYLDKRIAEYNGAWATGDKFTLADLTILTLINVCEHASSSHATAHQIPSFTFSSFFLTLPSLDWLLAFGRPSSLACWITCPLTFTSSTPTSTASTRASTSMSRLVQANGERPASALILCSEVHAVVKAYPRVS